MKIITIILFLLVFKIQFLNCTPPPKCLSYKSDGTDGLEKNWYIFQLQKELGIYYWNSISGDKIIETLDRQKTLRFDNGSPFIRTFNQITENKDTGFNYVTYNENPGGNRNFEKDPPGNNPGGGHTKGFFIWNENGGIHVMHSIPRFPLYRTWNIKKLSASSKTLKRGEFEWRDIRTVKSVKDDARNGLQAFEHDLLDSPAHKDPNKQPAQYAYCNTISTKEINEGFIWRHLVLTNSIIGIVNGMEVRSSLSMLDSQKITGIDASLFPRVGLFQDTKFDYKKFEAEFKTHNDFYTLPTITESQIMAAINRDIAQYSTPGTFPLYILAKHAYYNVVYGLKKHFDTQESLYYDSDKLYYYQRDSYAPPIPVVLDGKEVDKTFIPRPDDDDDVGPPKNIWTFISELKVTNNQMNQAVSRLGDMFLQTQHYDDPDKKVVTPPKPPIIVAGRGFVPGLSPHIYQVEEIHPNGLGYLKRDMDHSKQSFSVTPIQKYVLDHDVGPWLTKGMEFTEKYSWFCVGDNNFMDKQSKRGGAVHCFKNPALCQFFSKIVASYLYLDSDLNVVTIERNQEIKQFVNTLLLKSVSDLDIKLDPLIEGLFPPPITTDLYYSEGVENIEVNFKYLEFKKEAPNSNIYSNDRPIIFCWDNYNFPSIIACKTIKCDETIDDFVCTSSEKSKFKFALTGGSIDKLNSNSDLKLPTNELSHTFKKEDFINYIDGIFFYMVIDKILYKTESKEAKFFYNSDTYIIPLYLIKTHQDIINFCQDSSSQVLYMFHYGLDIFYYCNFIVNEHKIPKNFKFFFAKEIQGISNPPPDYEIPAGHLINDFMTDQNDKFYNGIVIGEWYWILYKEKEDNQGLAKSNISKNKLFNT